MSLNSTHIKDSSGSEDEQGFHIAREMHYHASCRYTKFKTVLGERVVYVWLRSCLCGQYNSYDIRYGVTSLAVDLDGGKDVHFSAECRWRKVRKYGGWELSKRCINCGSPSLTSYTGNTNDTTETNDSSCALS